MYRSVDYLILSPNTRGSCSGCKKALAGQIIYKYKELLCNKCFVLKYKCKNCNLAAIIILDDNDIKLCNTCAWKYFIVNPTEQYTSIVNFYEYGNESKIGNLRKKLVQSNPNQLSYSIAQSMTKLCSIDNPSDFYKKNSEYLSHLDEEPHKDVEHVHLHFKAIVFSSLITNSTFEALLYFKKALLINELVELAILCLNYAKFAVLSRPDNLRKLEEYYSIIQEDNITKKRLKIFIQLFTSTIQSDPITLVQSEFLNSELQFNDFYFIRQDLVKYIFHFKIYTNSALKIVVSHYDYVKNFMPNTCHAFDYYTETVQYLEQSQNQDQKLKIFFCELTIEISLELYPNNFSLLISTFTLLASSKIKINDSVGVPQILSAAYEGAQRIGEPSKTKNLIEIFELFHKFYQYNDEPKAERARKKIESLRKPFNTHN